MNKTDLIKAVAIEAELTQRDASNAVSAVFDIMTRRIAKGEKVIISGFGVFEVRERSERVRLIPGTREEVVVPAKKVPVFKAGVILKNFVDR